MACRRALKFAADIQVQRIHLELDCQALVQKSNHQGKDLSASGSWVEDIKSQLRGFVDFRVSWVRRSANVAAHKLAKIGVGEELCSVWQGSPPDCILDVIADDIPNLV
ncbi:ADP-ribosylation factor-like protein 8B-A [Hordeum vulgare]|nr:ADP-ribosylation factor-like protein 8B-A [Hordeum vulgare]